ncbi:MAG: hypothetical protein Q7S47_00065 [bacterium]|nr:hypothetical protein [bacterium]
MKEDKIVIGVTGCIRAGKEMVARYLARCHGAVEVSSSDALYKTLDFFGVPRVRKNSQHLSTFLRTSFRDSVLEHPIVHAIEQSHDRLFVVTSLRRESDFSELKKRFQFYLVFVDAPLERRYQWFLNELKDPLDRDMTLEEFCVRDAAESETLIEDLRMSANGIIYNQGTITDLERQVSRFLESIDVEFWQTYRALRGLA